jgi:hypothetical protein
MSWDIRMRESNDNYKNLEQFSVARRGEDWDATLRFIRENICK